MNAFAAPVEAQAQAVGHLLAASVKTYFQDAEHLRKYEEWLKSRNEKGGAHE